MAESEGAVARNRRDGAPPVTTGKGKETSGGGLFPLSG